MSDQNIANSSAQLKTGNDQMWWLGGNQQGPSPATNPVRQGLGNVAEWIGTYLTPWKSEGYLSERIAGGPTNLTGQAKATDNIPQYDPNYGPQPNPNPQPNPKGTGTGTGGNNNPNPQNPNPDNSNQESPEARAIREANDRMRGQIEGGYTDYFNQLDQMFSGLDTQANANLGIVNNSYNQSIADLQANKASSLGDLGLTEQKLQNNQVKSLRDIASNIQNQYMAGNVMLGARGAGDSSAANQYSYALNRVGSKARGDVMNQTAQSQQEIENQKAKLNNIVTQETSRLDTELGKVKLGISEWLAEQQNAVRGMIAEGKLNKGKDLAGLTQNLLNQALSAYQTKAQEISAKKSQLETWAMNNSTNINQLKSNLQSIGQFTPNMPVAGALNGSLSSDAQGNVRGIYNYGGSNFGSKEEEEKRRGY